MAAEGLSDEQLKELKQLAAEPDEKNIMTLDELNKATDKWRNDKQFVAELDRRYDAMETGKDKGFTVEQKEASITKLRKNKYGK